MQPKVLYVDHPNHYMLYYAEMLYQIYVYILPYLIHLILVSDHTSKFIGPSFTVEFVIAIVSPWNNRTI